MSKTFTKWSLVIAYLIAVFVSDSDNRLTDIGVKLGIHNIFEAMLHPFWHIYPIILVINTLFGGKKVKTVVNIDSF